MRLGSTACQHGAGKLFDGHVRLTLPARLQAQEEDGKQAAEQNDQAENESFEDEVAEGSPEPETEARPTSFEMDTAARDAQLLVDLQTRGIWPITADQAQNGGGCPVLEGQGMVRWREYQWCVQRYVDRAGKAQEKKVQVFVTRTGSRQDFLATYKRKVLEWLPHRLHLGWDLKWQRNSPDPSTFTELVDSSTEPVTSSSSEKVRNMVPGEVEIRIDFIKNAEMKSPNQAQREFFISQYLSLHCAVVQWKTVGDLGVEVLHSQTYMFCSDDSHHDGAFAAHTLAYLVKEVYSVFFVPLYARFSCCWFRKHTCCSLTVFLG